MAYKDSFIEWIGEIPENWNLERLVWHLEEVKENNDPIKTNSVLSLTNKLGVVPYEDKGAQGNVAKADYSQYKIAYPDTIVANSMNILIGSVGICNYYGCVSPVYYVYKAKKDTSLEFINYIFQTEQFQKELRKYANGILEIRLRVSSNDILKQTIAIPSYNDQIKVVNEINSKAEQLKSLIGNLNAQIDKLKDYKKALITKCVTKGLDPNVPLKDSGIDWIGNIPEKWNVVKGRRLFNQRNTKGNNIELQLLSPTQKYGVIPQDMYEELSGMAAVKLQEGADLTLLKTIHKGDFCISLRSFQGGFEYSLYEGVVSPAYHVFYSIVEIGDTYYKYLFKSDLFIFKMRSYPLTLRDGKNISFSDFGNTLIPYPPIDEQHKIGLYLDRKCSEIDALISSKQQQIDKLNEYQKSLIYEYVTGKKEVV